MSDLTDADALPLREVIRGLRDEILAAATEGQGSKLKFALGPIRQRLPADRSACADRPPRRGPRRARRPVQHRAA